MQFYHPQAQKVCDFFNSDDGLSTVVAESDVPMADVEALSLAEPGMFVIPIKRKLISLLLVLEPDANRTLLAEPETFRQDLTGTSFLS